MCGICGFAGVKQSAAPILREMLAIMEKYRLGYESAGIATVHKKRIMCLKNVGSVEQVFPSNGAWSERLLGSIGLGHVRYPSPEAPVGNSKFAHPFQSCDDKIVLVHNGTISDFKKIMHELERHSFSSWDAASNNANDSEVIVHLLEERIKRNEANVIDAVRNTCHRLSRNPRNQFLFAFIYVDEPEKIYVVSGRDFEGSRKVAVAFKDGFGWMFASYRDKGIRFEALKRFINPEVDRIEVLDYDTLAVLTSTSCRLVSL